MILITGGRYQGKLDFARERYGLNDDDIFICTEETSAPDFSRRCVAYLEGYALNRVRSDATPTLAPAALRSDAVLIVTDISCGIVPVDPVLRAWREACGRMTNTLAREADEVWRLFCGIPQRVK